MRGGEEGEEAEDAVEEEKDLEEEEEGKEEREEEKQVTEDEGKGPEEEKEGGVRTAKRTEIRREGLREAGGMAGTGDRA